MAAPTITGVAPATGLTPGGTSVVLTGTGFTGATAVNFGTVAGTGVVVNSDTRITVTAPEEAAGTVDITVTTPGGTSSAVTADQFVYGTTYTQPDGTEDATYYEDVQISPATVQDGTLAQRLDTKEYPETGHTG